MKMWRKWEIPEECELMSVSSVLFSVYKLNTQYTPTVGSLDHSRREIVQYEGSRKS